MAERREQEAGSTERQAQLADRRRPGRPEHVSPELIPLLRGQFSQELPPEPEEALAVTPDTAPLLMGLAYAIAALAIGTFLRFAV